MMHELVGERVENDVECAIGVEVEVACGRARKCKD